MQQDQPGGGVQHDAAEHDPAAGALDRAERGPDGWRAHGGLAGRSALDQLARRATREAGDRSGKRRCPGRQHPVGVGRRRPGRAQRAAARRSHVGRCRRDLGVDEDLQPPAPRPRPWWAAGRSAPPPTPGRRRRCDRPRDAVARSPPRSSRRSRRPTSSRSSTLTCRTWVSSCSSSGIGRMSRSSCGSASTASQRMSAGRPSRSNTSRGTTSAALWLCCRVALGVLEQHQGEERVRRLVRAGGVGVAERAFPGQRAPAERDVRERGVERAVAVARRENAGHLGRREREPGTLDVEEEVLAGQRLRRCPDRHVGARALIRYSPASSGGLDVVVEDHLADLRVSHRRCPPSRGAWSGRRPGSGARPAPAGSASSRPAPQPIPPLSRCCRARRPCAPIR